jgi:hypothetical protein
MGWALKIETFLGPEMAMSEAGHLGPRKSRFLGPTPSNGPIIKIIKFKRHIKTDAMVPFMYLCHTSMSINAFTC